MTVGFDSEVDELKHELANKQAAIVGWEHLYTKRDQRATDLEFRIVDAMGLLDGLEAGDPGFSLAMKVQTILAGKVA